MLEDEEKKMLEDEKKEKMIIDFKDEKRRRCWKIRLL